MSQTSLPTSLLELRAIPSSHSSTKTIIRESSIEEQFKQSGVFGFTGDASNIETIRSLYEDAKIPYLRIQPVVGCRSVQLVYAGVLLLSALWWACWMLLTWGDPTAHTRNTLRQIAGLIQVGGTIIAHYLSTRLLECNEMRAVGEVVFRDSARKSALIQSLHQRSYYLLYPFVITAILNCVKAAGEEHFDLYRTVKLLLRFYVPYWLTFLSQWGCLVVMALAIQLSANLVDTFCVQLEAQTVAPHAIAPERRHAGRVEASLIAPGFYSSLYRSHLVLDNMLDDLWAKAGGPLVALTIPWLWDAFYGVVRVAMETEVWKRTYYSINVCAIGVMFVVFLKGAESVTESCMSLRSGKRSIRSISAVLGGREMPTATRVEHIQFMQHLDRTPVGIEMPLVGLINRAFMSSKVNLILKLIPVFVTLGLKLLGNDNHAHADAPAAQQ